MSYYDSVNQLSNAKGTAIMPMSTTWFVCTDTDQEVLQMVAVDSHDQTVQEREHLIQVAAALMESCAVGSAHVDTPLLVEVHQEGDLGLKMVATYPLCDSKFLNMRMAKRRRCMLRAAA
jgi:hypothetical protein